MNIFSGLLSGFQSILQPANFIYCFAGVFIGTLVGVLPGIGPIGAMSILFPATFGLSPAASIIMLGEIYYGAMYGGSTTSILVNIPGEAASVVTCLDGYQMARQGRAGPALGISALGSFIGGTFSIVALMFLVFPLAEFAVKFGPPEYFALICLSMTVLTYLARGSFIKAVLMALLGLILGSAGMDPISGRPRFSFGSTALLDGVGLVPVAMRLFGISEVIMNIEAQQVKSVLKTKVKNLFPNLQDWKKSIGPIGRGSILGFLVGILPGGGAVMSTFLSYTLEKRLSKNPSAFGKGAIEGVAGPETANNAGSGGAFVPLLALGIPSNPIMGILLGALMVHGVNSGPLLLKQHPEIFWGVIASMYLGNVMLLLLNLPLIGIWVKVLEIPNKILMPLILLCCLIGAYAANNNKIDVIIMIIFGVVGYILRKYAPWKTFQEFMDYARKNPGVKWGHQGIGTTVYIRMENLNRHANLKLTGVPLKGDAEIITNLIGNHIQVGTLAAGTARPQAEGGKLRILFSFDPPKEFGLDPKIPDFATVFGNTFFDFDIPVYLSAPAKTPKDIIQILENGLAKISTYPEFQADVRKINTMPSFVPCKKVNEELIPQRLKLMREIMKDIIQTK